ncbi:MAG: VOC family protein [Bacteroidales bacterium]|nr:VOC family protein [Bacteroidales bacterium]
MKERIKVISAIQQIGIGVPDAQAAWKWYIEQFGIDIRVLASEGVADRMLPYTGGKPQPRFAILALNHRGGGGFEVWEPRGRELNWPASTPLLGDTGIFICKVKCPDVQLAYDTYKSRGLDLLGEPCKSFAGLDHFYLKDPWGNIFEIEEDYFEFTKVKGAITGGSNGVVLGVSDMEKSIEFYGKLLGYDRKVADAEGVFEDIKGVPGAEQKLRRVMLERSQPLQGPFSAVLGTSHLELVQSLDRKPVKLYQDRFWGDPGYIHLCFDVRNMEAIRKDCEAAGHPFVCDSGSDFGMGEANGHFTYIEDPDGTLIEFVETYKVPIHKKLGIYLNLAGKDDRKPLPRIITKAFRFLRVKPEK